MQRRNSNGGRWHSFLRCVDQRCFHPTCQLHQHNSPPCYVLTLIRLQAGKVQSARIRVENIIRSDIATELHEILELYCELLLARSQLLEQAPTPSSASSSSIPLDPALEEAVRSIIYAAPRTEIKELHTVRALLVEKFGKDVALASMEGEGVAERVVRKLKGEIPGDELVDAYLSEIARFYGVSYGPSQITSTTEDDDDDDQPGNAEAELEGRIGEGDEKEEELVKATPPRKLGPQSPLRVVPPSPSTDNVAPKLKLPGKAAEKVARTEGKKREDGLGKIPDVDELAKRFAQLKR